MNVWGIGVTGNPFHAYSVAPAPYTPICELRAKVRFGGDLYRNIEGDLLRNILALNHKPSAPSPQPSTPRARLYDVGLGGGAGRNIQGKR